MSERIIGYLLLGVGLMLIIYSAFNVVSVFGKRAKPVDVFNLSGISLDLSGMIGSDLSPQERVALEQGNVNTKAELISPEVLNTPLNFAFHLLFMGFVATIGFKVASLGVMLVRPIKVKMKEDIAPK